MLINTDIPVLQNYKIRMFAEESMIFHHLSGDMEITFKILFCVSQIIISTRILVKAVLHRRYGKALTNILIEMDMQSSIKKLISEYRNSDFKISRFAISRLKNIQQIRGQDLERLQWSNFLKFGIPMQKGP